MNHRLNLCQKLSKQWGKAAFFIIASCFPVTVTAQEIPAGMEMIRNGALAQGMLESSCPRGWTVSENSNVTLSLEEGALKLQRTKKEGWFCIGQRVPREPESKYRLSFKAKVEGNGTLEYNAEGYFRSGWVNVNHGRLTKCDWTPVTMEFEIPETKDGCAVNEIGIELYPSGENTTAYLSSVSLVPVADPNRQSKDLFLAADDQKVVCGGIRLVSNPSYYEVRAAKDLRQYLYKVYGAFVPVMTAREKGASVKGQILIGQAALDAEVITRDDINFLTDGGYWVRLRDGCLGIAGKDGPGTISGVYGLLERLGVRFLAASEAEWKSPDSPVIAEMVFTRSPAFEFRTLNIPDADCVGYTDFHCVGSPREVGAEAPWEHTPNLLVNYNFYHKDHPEYYSLTKRGERMKTSDMSCVHLCMSNPDVQRIALQSVLRWIELQPDRKYFMVDQGDWQPWCECEKCRALDVVPGNMSDRLLTFVNIIAREVARKYPDKKIFTAAYGLSVQVPQRVRPEKNVIVLYCPSSDAGGGRRCQSHAFCEMNPGGGMGGLVDWLKLCPGQMYIFDYPAAYKCPMDVFGSFYTMVDKVRFYARHGIKGIYFCGAPSTFNALFQNVMSQLTWNPEMNVEKASDEFMARYYGKAAPMMRSYFDLIYREIEERPVHHLDQTGAGLVTTEFAAEGYALFEQAIQAAGNDPKIIRRINDEKIHLLFSDMNERNIANGLAKRDEAFALKLAELIRLSAERKITCFVNYNFNGPNPVEWFWQTARLRFDGDKYGWWKGKKVEEFLRHPILPKYQMQEVIPGGWRLLLEGVKGGLGPELNSYKCEPKMAVWIQRAGSPNARMAATLFLDDPPGIDMELALEGQDDDKPGQTPIEILVNGQSIFRGENALAECGWSKRVFAMPPGLLKKGENKIEFVNLMTNAPPDAVAKKDYTWGWFMLSEIIVRQKNPK